MPSDETPNIETLRGKHAVVTGGARGIGLGIATLLAQRGLRVSIVSRTAMRLLGQSAAHRRTEESAAAQRHTEESAAAFFRVQADVTDETQVAQALALCRDANGPIAVLVNNAGIAESAPLKRTTSELWDRTLATNLTGTFVSTRAAIDDMIAAGWGRIVNVASTAGLEGGAYLGAYCASKHGVVGFTRAIAAEFAGTAITANALCPGYTETEMLHRALANVVKHTGANEEAARAHLARTNPLGRIATVEEVAEAAYALIAGDQTGTAVVVPGEAREL